MMRVATAKRLFLASLLWGILLALLMTAGLAVARDIPDYTGYVNDYAEMISDATERRLERMLTSFDKSDSTQVAVLTIDSLEGDSLEDFSIRVVDKWSVGQAGKDNGVLLLVVKKERKSRIEVGRGLEGVLTDLLSGRIVDLVITPRFKAGEFDQGFENGVQAIIRATRGEFKTVAGRRAGKTSSHLPTYLIIGFIIIHVLGRVSKVLGGVAGAVMLPIIGFAGLLLPFAILTLLLLMFVGGLVGLLLPRMAGLPIMFGGGSGGFGGGSGGGGFGGFGGGSFGGGGASGDW